VNWTRALTAHREWASLLAPAEAEQIARGYGHTLREILQQPETWVATGRQVSAASAMLRAALAASELSARGAIILTGSGSSLYAAECAALPMQAALGGFVQAVPAGLLLTHAPACLPADRPFLLVSLARSGNSPESAAVVDLLLETRPQGAHLILTCNSAGRLATRYRDNARVRVLVLDPRTHDQSLVMTSSFTNLVVAVGALGRLGNPAPLEQRAEAMARVGSELLLHAGPALATCARSDFTSAVYLGSGAASGAAHEAALKMLEMTGGRVPTLAESFLGLRHGPMSAVHSDALIVAFLSTDTRIRAYELDVLRELDRKGLGAARVLVGEAPPAALIRVGDVAVSPRGLSTMGEDEGAVIDVLAGQLLAFFRCLSQGGKPDAPSPAGVIQRVVEQFAIYE
jgi:tagatose-6-phosphate ketose/aldose isomerase